MRPQLVRPTSMVASSEEGSPLRSPSAESSSRKNLALNELSWSSKASASTYASDSSHLANSDFGTGEVPESEQICGCRLEPVEACVVDVRASPDDKAMLVKLAGACLRTSRISRVLPSSPDGSCGPSCEVLPLREERGGHSVSNPSVVSLAEAVEELRDLEVERRNEQLRYFLRKRCCAARRPVASPPEPVPPALPCALFFHDPAEKGDADRRTLFRVQRLVGGAADGTAMRAFGSRPCSRLDAVNGLEPVEVAPDAILVDVRVCPEDDPRLVALVGARLSCGRRIARLNVDDYGKVECQLTQAGISSRSNSVPLEEVVEDLLTLEVRRRNHSMLQYQQKLACSIMGAQRRRYLGLPA